MGRKPSYTTEDYATRVELFIRANPEPEHRHFNTEDIMKGVMGTNSRVMEGLFYLAMKKTVVAKVSRHHITWELRG